MSKGGYPPLFFSRLMGIGIGITYIFIQNARGGEVIPPSLVWILAFGVWNDLGEWVDTDNWID